MLTSKASSAADLPCVGSPWGPGESLRKQLYLWTSIRKNPKLPRRIVRDPIVQQGCHPRWFLRASALPNTLITVLVTD